MTLMIVAAGIYTVVSIDHLISLFKFHSSLAATSVSNQTEAWSASVVSLLPTYFMALHTICNWN